MPFNFAQFVAQGAAARQQRIQRAEDNAFRRLVEERIADQGQQGLDLQEEAGKRAQQQIDNQVSQFGQSFGLNQEVARRQLAQTDSRIGIEQDRFGLEQQRFGLLEDQFVDIAGPNGQTASINIRDLLGDQRARIGLGLQRRAQDFAQSPLDLSGLSAFGAARTGDFSQLPQQVGIREAQAFAIPSIQHGLTAEGSFNESEQIRNRGIIEGTREAGEFLDDNLQPINRENIPINERGIIPFLRRSFEAAGAATTPGGIRALQDRKSRQVSAASREFEKITSNVRAVGNILDRLPADAEPAALARFAPQVQSVLRDASDALSASNLPKSVKKNESELLIEVSRDFLDKMSPADPVVSQLRERINKAARKGNLKDIQEATKAIADYTGVFAQGNQQLGF
jgi:hypothetical protein